MRLKFGSLADWQSFDGSKKFSLPGDGARPLRFSGVTEGASVVVSDDNGTTLVFSGGGNFEVDCGVVGETVIVVEAEGMTSIRIEGVKAREVGWTKSASFADLEPKSFGQVAPEVQAMFDLMQRNMMAREARLIEQLKKA